MFRDPAAARAAEEQGRQAVREFSGLFRQTHTSYQTTEVVRNALILYLTDPSTHGAAAAKARLERCLAAQ